jgi:hypothetical protein
MRSPEQYASLPRLHHIIAPTHADAIYFKVVVSPPRQLRPKGDISIVPDVAGWISERLIPLLLLETTMFKRLKATSLVGVFLLASVAAPSLSAAPSAAVEFAGQFWTETMMKVIDTNKDGMVSRDEFLAYMGSQFDRMDQNKDRMLSAREFTDKKMMATTFPSSASEHGR